MMDSSDEFTWIQEHWAEGFFVFAVFRTICVCQYTKNLISHDHHTTIREPVIQELNTNTHRLHRGQLCHLCEKQERDNQDNYQLKVQIQRKDKKTECLFELSGIFQHVHCVFAEFSAKGTSNAKFNIK